MSEQRASFPDDVRAWLTELGPDSYALAWVGPATGPGGWAETEPPAAGESGAARPDFDHARLALEEVARGRSETLRRWTQLDEGQRQLAIISSDGGTLREHTPGDLVDALLHGSRIDQDQLAGWLREWFERRSTAAPQGLELGWITAAAAWATHMRAFNAVPPPAVLFRAVAASGQRDEAIEDLVISTSADLADLLQRLPEAHRPRQELIEDWRTLEPLTADVPVLRETADRLLDQIALRDAHAQQLRAVLEPDITDYLRDRRGGDHLLDAAAVPVLDRERTTHLIQARETVRAYTAAAHAGREQEAQHILDAFPIPGRPLGISFAAAAWRRRALDAQPAVDDLAAQRQALAAEENYSADPELMHAQTAYLAAREGQLHLLHDLLGRLVDPAPVPRELPFEVAEFAAAQSLRRVIEAFGTTHRARQSLEGRFSYLQERPVPASQRAAVEAEGALLTEALRKLGQIPGMGGVADESSIRARTQRAMARPILPTRGPRPTRTGVEQAQQLTVGRPAPGARM
jgi:hypothetical protein